MHWFYIRDGATLKLVGPVPKWQMACIRGFGIIDKGMLVKDLGERNWSWSEKRWNSFLEERKNEYRGWFKPMIVNEQGMTFDIDGALGPSEIGMEVGIIADRMKVAGSIAEIGDLWGKANPYLKFLPLELCSKLSDVYNSYRDILVKREEHDRKVREQEILEREQSADSGGQDKIYPTA